MCMCKFSTFSCVYFNAIPGPNSKSVAHDFPSYLFCFYRGFLFKFHSAIQTEKNAGKSHNLQMKCDRSFL